MTASDRYLLDNQQAEAGQRFSALSSLFDPSTFRHIEQMAIARDARIWEVGAGGPSVARWLAEDVAPDGQVIATDIDTSWIDLGGTRPSYEVRRHDVGVDPAPEGLFDLVHARLLLVHVPARERALASMVGALRPGGWLLIEEADPQLQPLVCPDEWDRPQQLANRLKNGFRVLLAERGVDLAFGRTLPRRLRSAGLADVGCDAYFPMAGPVCAALERATVEQVRRGLVAAGLASEAEIEEHLANVARGTLDLATSPLISAWGRMSTPSR